tara:strand:+ start:88565 stop:89377 length:813 start_codon:yes stop_codon:yes gene_type:complete
MRSPPTQAAIISMAIFLMLTGDASGQAGNDCASAVPVTIGSASFSNAGYTNSPTPWSCWNANNDRWFVFVPPVTMPYTISACSGSLTPPDTILNLYSGSCGQLTLLDCADDDCGHLGLGAEVHGMLQAGLPYFIRVGVIGGSTAAAYPLSISQGPGALALTTASGCGSATLSFSGLPTFPTSFTTTIENFTGTPFVGAGLQPASQAICSCVVGHDWSVHAAGPSLQILVPPTSSMLGLQFFVQGADFAGGSACAGLGLALTDTYQVTIGT